MRGSRTTVPAAEYQTGRYSSSIKNQDAECLRGIPALEREREYCLFSSKIHSHTTSGGVKQVKRDKRVADFLSPHF